MKTKFLIAALWAVAFSLAGIGLASAHPYGSADSVRVCGATGCHYAERATEREVWSPRWLAKRVVAAEPKRQFAAARKPKPQVAQYKPRPLVGKAPVPRHAHWLERHEPRQAYDIFRGLEWAHHHTVAMIGHIQHESAFNTRILGDGGISIGLAQWNGNRRKALKHFARSNGLDPYSVEAQVRFIDHELRTSERMAYDALHRSRTVEEATAAFMHFERPRHYQPHRPQAGLGWHSRLSHARSAASRFGKTEVSHYVH